MGWRWSRGEGFIANRAGGEWPDLIDLNAGTIATGQASIQDVGWAVFHLLLEVASGRKSLGGALGIANALALFNPGPVT